MTSVGSNRKLRALLQARDGHCQLCAENNLRKLTIHHQFGHTPERKRDPRRSRPEYMTILCVRCHSLYNWAMANFDRRNDRTDQDEQDWEATG